ncbi:MAG: shikimate dehydrogenase [Bacteroidetes bacterium]|nr:MAG: shikimate dehydrogenase [Bacteroidota bacterium]
MKRLFGLIGTPLSHSFSKTYFTEKFASEKILDAKYKEFPLKEIGMLPELIEKNPDLLGLNVTIPYKLKVMNFMDEVDSVANDVGAVNTIVVTRDKDYSKSISLKGYNTDVKGFELSLVPIIGPEHTSALVLGSGGAARAIIYVLKKLGIDYKVVSRNPTGGRSISYDDLTKDIMESHSLIINSSPVGIEPNTGAAPNIPYEYLNSTHILYDLIYNPEETEFLKRGKLAGATTKNGLEMLKAQAEKSWEIWNL